MFYCCRRHKVGIKALLCNTFILLRMKLFNNTQRIVTFPLQQRLCDRSVMLRYTYRVFSFCLTDDRRPSALPALRRTPLVGGF